MPERYGMTEGLELEAREAFAAAGRYVKQPKAKWWATSPTTGTTVGIMEHEAEVIC